MTLPDSDVRGLLERLIQQMSDAAEEFVPWFCAQMPEAYFRNVDENKQLGHMGVLMSLRSAGLEPKLRMTSADGRQITFLVPEDKPGTLQDLVADVSRDTLIRAARLYTSEDKQLVLDVFDVGEEPRCDLRSSSVQQKLTETLDLARERGLTWTEAQLASHFEKLTEEYVRTLPAYRILAHAEHYAEVHRSGGASVEVGVSDCGERSRVVVAVANVPARRMLLRISRRLGSLKANIVRSYVDTIEAGAKESVVILSLVVESPEGGIINPDSMLWHRLRTDLLRLKWLSPETIELGNSMPELDLGGADIFHCYRDLVHKLLLKKNRYIYGRLRIHEAALAQPKVTVALIRLFMDRFNPDAPLDEGSFEQRRTALAQQIESTVDDEVEQTVLATMLAAVTATLKTNYYVDSRYALALRLDPQLLAPVSPRDEVPFGVFFVHGRSFNAFHVRFRDTARGGMRVVRPTSQEAWLRETERHYDEAYELAYAQQLKNKDIPEGGAKAVILVEPEQTITRCVRAFADGIIDLLPLEGRSTSGRVVDLYGAPEWVYLGPDENILPEHIEWIAARARHRGYAFPNALISSKPGAGINHKEYGVTSEGVNVFLQVALQSIGIDPTTQPFSVKLTGGPDGDVGGNAIRIFIRDYGERVRFVGIADGFGCAIDPEGLDHEELLRLVDESRSIAEFDAAKLSNRGRLGKVSDHQGFRLRNDMHNIVQADAFVPAGGRPATISESNWERFLNEGVPSSKVIVEGANLFLTPGARQRLFEQGVVVVKDSSANKCGVICSSFEIVASLILSEEEFLAIKPVFVAQVLDRLRAIAGLEAELLFQEHRRRPQTSLVELSTLLSHEINRLTDAIAENYKLLDDAAPNLLRQFILAHIPPVLVEKSEGRLWEKLPLDYRAQIACAAIASRIVYREGLDYIRDTPTDRLAQIALDYVLQERRCQQLVQEVEASGLDNKAEIANLLRIGGTRAGLQGHWHQRAMSFAPPPHAQQNEEG